MQFQLVQKHEFWWPVTVKVPADGGSIVEQSFEVRFTAQTRDDAIAAIEKAAQTRDPRARAELEYEQLRSVVTDWRGVIDQDRAALPFSETAFAQACQTTWFRAGLNAAYADALNGVGAAGN